MVSPRLSMLLVLNEQFLAVVELAVPLASMAQTSHTAGMYICRSCRHALKRATTYSSSFISLPTARAFTNTSQRHKALPTFQPTASPDLDALLASWRTKVFLPSSLAPQHQDLVHKPSRQDILLNAPGVTVTLPLIHSQSSVLSGPPPEEEDIQLQPQARWDRPNFKQSLLEYVDILGNTGEISIWETLPGFLEGLRLARYSVPPAWLEKVARKAGEADPCRVGIVLRCAEMVDRTRVSLAERALSREILLGTHKRAMGILLEDERGTARAFEGEPRKTLDRFVLLLEKEGHCGALTDLDFANGLVDMRKDSLLIGVLLEFAAGRAILQHDRKDADGQVGVLVQTLLAISEAREANGKTLVEMEDTSPRVAYEEVVVLKSAMQMALNVDMVASLTKQKELGTRIALQNLHKRLEDETKGLYDTLRQEANGKYRRGLEMQEVTNQAHEKMRV